MSPRIDPVRPGSEGLPSIAGPIVVAGAGALGSVYGGLLAAAGHDVAFMAHGAHENALRRGPLTLETAAGTHRTSIRVPDEAEANAGIVILTAKAFDTDAVLARVRGAPVLAISLQNGVGKNNRLLARFGVGAVAGAVSTIPARLLEPGFAYARPGVTYVGGSDGPAGAHVTALAQALAAVGLVATIVPDARSIEFSKVAHVATAAADRVLGRHPDAVRGFGRGRRATDTILATAHRRVDRPASERTLDA